MRAAILRQGEIVVGDIAEPKPGPGQVLVKTLACGICGTDLHARLHAGRMSGMSRHVTWRKAMDPARDVVFGHEFCSEILSYGPGSGGRLRPGTRVISVPRLLVDGRAESIGFSNDNIGAYAERMLLSEAFLLEVPAHVSSEIATLVEPLAVGIHAVAKAGLTGDEVPLVIGCGPVGLAVVAALKLAGAGPIIASDYSPARRDMARRLGADVVVDPAAGSPFKTWEEHARTAVATPAGAAPALNPAAAFKPAVIFECVGVPGVVNSIYQAAPQEARIVVVGVCMEPDTTEPLLAIYKELSVQFVLAYTPAEFARSLELVASGKVDVGAMITGKVGLDGVADAFRDLASPERHTKIVIEPWR